MSDMAYTDCSYCRKCPYVHYDENGKCICNEDMYLACDIAWYEDKGA